MGPLRSRRVGSRGWAGFVSVSAIAACLAAGAGGWPSRAQAPAAPERRSGEGEESRVGACQVTVIGILATPGSSGVAIDPRLANIKNPLRKLVPDHGFKLLDVRSDRITAGNAVQCDMGKETVARVTLVSPLDPNGKVKLRCELSRGKVRLMTSEVATPLNQLFFCEHKLDDGTRLLIGVGAR